MDPEEEIQAGDTVKTKGREISGYHPIKYIVEEIKILYDVRMACGPYGCISCDLLEKVPNENT